MSVSSRPGRGGEKGEDMQYPRVITLIDKYMGYDTLRYFRALREEQAERENNLARSITDLKAKVHDLTVHIAEMESDFNDQ